MTANNPALAAFGTSPQQPSRPLSVDEYLGDYMPRVRAALRIALGDNPPEWRYPLGYDERDAKI